VVHLHFFTLSWYAGRRERKRRLPATGQGEGLIGLPLTKIVNAILRSQIGVVEMLK
jgi:hypothetical protein